MGGGETIGPRGSREKVSRACQRCRRQKLKCDPQRPCVPCARSGTSCQPSVPGKWKAYSPPSDPTTRPPKRPRTTESEPVDRPTENTQNTRLRNNTSVSVNQTDRSSTEHQSLGEGNDQPWKSSSTMALVDGAFEFHNATAPEASLTDAIPGGQQRKENITGPRERSLTRGAGFDTIPPTMRLLTQSSRTAVSELKSLLPTQEAAALLIDTYFDRVHWFMLIFYQDEFRQRWKHLYSHNTSQPTSCHQDADFLSVLLLVIAIGLQYTGAHRRRLLATYNVDIETLSERIFSAIQAKLLDILSFGSLEAVQTCILLGTYYLYHGSPGLAWPVCGCGLRIAQALNLHRKPARAAASSAHSADWRKQYETKKRCWWAIYEVETFCSMSYGYPHSIKDIDCDVEPLDPSAKSQIVLSPKSFDEPLTCGATLLSYKYFMSKLSVLIKTSLAELYRIGSSSAKTPPGSSTTRLLHLVEKVAELEAKLQQWYTELPPELQIETHSSAGASYSAEELDLDIGASSPRFYNHIFQLQALTLKLAYDNARILVHRPLLSYKLVNSPSGQEVGRPREPVPLDQSRLDPFRSSLQSCREAALSTSEVAAMPIAELASSEYSAAFVGIHTFTAGITLGILSSLEPLSHESHLAKNGLHRLIRVQTKLKSRYPMAAQSLEILQRLTKHIMERELTAILNVEKPLNTPAHTTNARAATEDITFSAGRYPSVHQKPAGWPSSDHAIRSTESATVNGFVGFSGDLPIEGAEDPALSQAVYDFDQAILNQDLPTQGGTPISSSLFWPPADDLPALEQAWIWGLDSFAPPE